MLEEVVDEEEPCQIKEGEVAIAKSIGIINKERYLI